MIISLLVERYLPAVQAMRNRGWQTRYLDGMQARALAWHLNGPLGIVAILVIPVVLVLLLDIALGYAWPPVSWLFDIAVVSLMLGPRGLDGDIKAYTRARESGDLELMRESALNLSGKITAEDDIPAMNRKVVESIFLQAFYRGYAIFFWYGLLGPVGAVLYRFTRSLAEKVAREEEDPGHLLRWVWLLQDLMVWPLARLMALGFGLGGSFVDSWHQAKQYLFKVGHSNLIKASGIGALNLVYSENIPEMESDKVRAQVGDAHVRQALELVRRTLLLFLALVGLLTLFGMLL